jgi:hypothetical protein
MGLVKDAGLYRPTPACTGLQATEPETTVVGTVGGTVGGWPGPRAAVSIRAAGELRGG